MSIVLLSVAIVLYCVLDHKKRVKMVKNSKTSYENEIRRVDSSSNEDSKNVSFFAREALISAEGRPENLAKMAKNREIYCYAN